ncbi:hypothetical protein [Lachnotalea glycerini]|uniref:hypothetical protein n=1 Tax=Lachnotalea glycerini TaxID=1763509 RepID=UPI000D771845|nr:hypothetical protein [Lachnotalea glycerini]
MLQRILRKEKGTRIVYVRWCEVVIHDYYYYKSLNAKEKQAYKEIHSGIQNYLDSICLANKGYTEDEIGNAALHRKYEPHAWNIVNIKGQACHLDSTWDVCNSKDGQINYDYFNVTDENIIKDHSDYSGVMQYESL